MIYARWKQDRWTEWFPGIDIFISYSGDDHAHAGLALHAETKALTGQAPPPGSQFYTEKAL